MRLTAAFLIPAVCGVVPAKAQQIPIRQLGPAEAVATTKVDAYSLVRPLSDGRVIVTYRRAVGLLSADLKTYTTIMDSTRNARSGVSPWTALIKARGDTTYVPDETAGGLIVVGPGGTPGVMIAIPKATDMGAVGFTALGTFRTYVDPKGRLWYRSSTSYDGAMGNALGRGALATVTPPADSFPLVRADFESRAVDTLAAVRIPSTVKTITDTVDGMRRMRSIRYPFAVIDAWTVLSDGTVAIVRGFDYHVDWIHPDGSRSSTPKMPFDWRRITDEEKAKLADSLQKLAVVSNARDSTNRATARPSASGRGSDIRVSEVAPVSTMPDYFPPLREGAARGDLDGNLWILPTTSANAQGGLLYDVVNQKGQLFERVQLPAGCALAGFGKDRVVYLTCPATSVERRRILN